MTLVCCLPVCLRQALYTVVKVLKATQLRNLVGLLRLYLTA